MAEGSVILERFLGYCEEVDARLAKGLSRLDDDAHPELARLLGRFQGGRSGPLGPEQRNLARRVLNKLHRPSKRGIELLGAALAYLGLDGQRTPEHADLLLVVEILELFCKADSVNDTLSQKELEMLLGVLDKLDVDKNGLLDADERARLRDELWDADAFLASMKS